MPVRDDVVIHMTEELTGVWREGISTYSRFSCPPADRLLAKGKTEDDWWAAVQAADDQYVLTGEAADWELAARIAREHIDGPETFHGRQAAEALQARQEELFKPETRPLEHGEPYLPYISWDRVVTMAEGHWLQRFRDTPYELEHGVEVDAEALRESFLSTESGNLWGCPVVAERRRDMRAIFKPRSDSRAASQSKRQEAATPSPGAKP